MNFDIKNQHTGAPKSADKKLVLLVDDDNEIIDALKKHLIGEGHEVSTASNGLIGLARAKREKPDLIVLDVVMPEMNGIDVLKELKKERATKKIPVIVFTSLCEDNDIVDITKNLGAIECFAKSDMLFDDLFERIKKTLASI